MQVDEFMRANGRPSPEALEQRRQTQDAERTIGQLQLVEKTAIQAKHLTNDERWDWFVQLIQTALEMAKGSQRNAENVLLAPQVMSEADLRQAKVSYIQASAQVTALEMVISLPKQLMEDGEKAKQVIEQHFASQQAAREQAAAAEPERPSTA